MLDGSIPELEWTRRVIWYIQFINESDPKTVCKSRNTLVMCYIKFFNGINSDRTRNVLKNLSVMYQIVTGSWFFDNRFSCSGLRRTTYNHSLSASSDTTAPPTTSSSSVDTHLTSSLSTSAESSAPDQQDCLTVRSNHTTCIWQNTTVT
jgi:hypothetical protein